jgi:hypothetical protein
MGKGGVAETEHMLNRGGSVLEFGWSKLSSCQWFPRPNFRAGAEGELVTL